MLQHRVALLRESFGSKEFNPTRFYKMLLVQEACRLSRFKDMVLETSVMLGHASFLS